MLHWKYTNCIFIWEVVQNFRCRVTDRQVLRSSHYPLVARNPTVVVTLQKKIGPFKLKFAPLNKTSCDCKKVMCELFPTKFVYTFRDEMKRTGINRHISRYCRPSTVTRFHVYLVFNKEFWRYVHDSRLTTFQQPLVDQDLSKDFWGDNQSWIIQTKKPSGVVLISRFVLKTSLISVITRRPAAIGIIWVFPFW